MENTAHKYDQDIVTKTQEKPLERKLKTRHLSMIAIGGTIGTGLFLADRKSVV